MAEYKECSKKMCFCEGVESMRLIVAIFLPFLVFFTIKRPFHNSKSSYLN